MDRQTAADLLDNLIGMVDDSQGNDYDTALKMGIEVLRTEQNGEWILVKGSNGKDYHKCSECLHTQEITGVKNYCAVCGARMEL